MLCSAAPPQKTSSSLPGRTEQTFAFGEPQHHWWCGRVWEQGPQTGPLLLVCFPTWLRRTDSCNFIFQARSQKSLDWRSDQFKKNAINVLNQSFPMNRASQIILVWQGLPTRASTPWCLWTPSLKDYRGSEGNLRRKNRHQTKEIEQGNLTEQRLCREHKSKIKTIRNVFRERRDYVVVLKQDMVF